MQGFQYLMVGLGLLLMVGIQGCAIPRDFLIVSCDTMEYTVLPGEAKDVLNPCEFTPGISSGGRWAPKDTFEFDFIPPLLPTGVRLDRIVDDKTGKVTRKLVAGPSGVELVEKRQVDYLYRNGIFFSPHGAFLTVSTVDPLQVSLIAIPPTINPGQPSQLRATATGGVPPYKYSWIGIPCELVGPTCTNDGTLSVSPTTSTRYTVSVEDKASFKAEASVIVNVSGSSSFRLTVVDSTGLRDLFVSSPDRIIACFHGANCSGLFPAGTNVILTADINFIHWSGCDAFTSSTCTVLMNADRTVTVLP